MTKKSSAPAAPPLPASGGAYVAEGGKLRPEPAPSNGASNPGQTTPEPAENPET